MKLWRTRKLNVEHALANAMQAASDLADAFISAAPTDRPISNDDLDSVETFIGTTVMSDMRETWAKTYSPSVVDIIADPIERKFRAAFSTRLRRMAMLANSQPAGQA